MTLKRRIFIDMDGVLATWNSDKSLEEVAMSGYYRDLVPMKNVVEAIRNIVRCEEYDVYILSSVLHDIAIRDKNYWLDTHLPEIPSVNRIYVPYGKRKCDYIGRIDYGDILLDDFSKNLREWHGIGIKLLNGINGTKGTWNGYVVNGNSNALCIKNSIMGITYMHQPAAS